MIFVIFFSCFLVARLKRRILTIEDVNKFKDATPPLKKGSSQMFRNLRDKGEWLSIHSAGAPHPSDINVNLTSFFAGIISYTEYLFLLSILTSKCASARFKVFFYTQTLFFCRTEIRL